MKDKEQALRVWKESDLVRKGLDFSSIVRIEGLFEERGRDKSHWHSADPAMVVARVKEG